MLIGPIAIISRAEYRRLKRAEEETAWLKDYLRNEDGDVVLKFQLTDEAEIKQREEEAKKPPPDLSKLTIAKPS